MTTTTETTTTEIRKKIGGKYTICVWGSMEA